MPIVSARRPSIAVVASPLDVVETDLLIVPWFEGDPIDPAAGLDMATGGDVGRALSSGEFTGRLYDLFVTKIVDEKWKSRRVALVGLGARPQFVTDLARRAAAAGALAARQRRAGQAAFALPNVAAAPEALAHTIAEGLTLSEF